jgi:ribosomal protein S18 acetylase RimI-like enzyme
MSIELHAPGVDDLSDTVNALREWQRDDAPLQLHPGDVGWFWRFGTEATAAGLRVWSRDGQIVAIGLLDGSDLLRVAVAPDSQSDDALARRMVDDVTLPDRGVLAAGEAYVEAPEGALLKDLLSDAGWQTDEPWTPLCRDLAGPVEDAGVRIEVVGPDTVDPRVEVQRASFDTSQFTEESWHAMAGGLPYSDARCLLAYSDEGAAVAAITVWSAGAGRPGVIEPMGVHRDHRGHGYGKAITLAGAAALRELGSSSALVCTPTANVAGVATYASAGFIPQPERRDRSRKLA